MKNTYSIIIYLIFTIFELQISHVIAQDLKVNEKITLNDSTHSVVHSVMKFEGINKYREYYNKKQLKHIYELNKEQKWKALYNALKKYVRKFGIQNFYKDTKLIWKLAKLTELFGNHEEAKSFYRMALRHHHEGINMQEIELYYDSLNTQEIELFVPLDYYYELVEHRKSIDTLHPPRGVLLNMGSNVNSASADYGPSLNIKDDVLFFTSKRNEIDETIQFRINEDLFFTKKDEYGTWSKAKPIKNLNSHFNEGSPCLSSDGKTMIFSRCECSECYGNCDLFITHLQKDSSWSKPKNMGVTINSVSWDSHPSLSHTGDTLYFASDRMGGFGLSDIYYSTKDEKGNWNSAKNIGPTINTRKNDVSPFYHHKHNMLYFSSNGQLYNFGEFDIYKSYLMTDNWSEPMNIGPLVNGIGSEFYFTIDYNSEHLFYARSTNGDLEKQDIYSFPLPMEAQPGAIVPLTGSLTDSLTGKPFRGIVSIIDLDKHVEVAPKHLKKDGTFQFDLINKRNYLLIIQGDDFFRIEEIFFLDGPMDIKKVTTPLSSKVKFESIVFDAGKSELKKEMYADLNKIVNFMYDNDNFMLKISGHTDTQGNAEKNLLLSKERANNIKDYMVIFAGILEDRVHAEGFGSTKPIIENEQSEEDKKINRRVEFEIYKDGEE